MHLPGYFLVATNPPRGQKQILQSRFRSVGGLLILLSAVLFAGSANAADKEDENTAWTLYRVRCALCHYIDRADVKFGPSLKDLFKRQNLMNGKPVNEQNVAEWIANGSENMPAFRYTLNDKEIQLVISYVKGDFEKQGSAKPAPGQATK